MSDINFQEALDKYILSERKTEIIKKNIYRASSLSGCVRQTARHRLGLRTQSLSSLRSMRVGTMVHRLMQTEVGLGHIGRPVEFERAVTLQLGDYLVTGHVDCWDGETVYDFKTISAVENAANYPMSRAYEYQVSSYIHALRARRGVIAYIDKKDLRILQKEVRTVPALEIAEFCRKVANAEEEYRRSGTLPERDDCHGCREEPHEEFERS